MKETLLKPAGDYLREEKKTSIKVITATRRELPAALRGQKKKSIGFERARGLNEGESFAQKPGGEGISESVESNRRKARSRKSEKGGPLKNRQSHLRLA